MEGEWTGQRKYRGMDRGVDGYESKGVREWKKNGLDMGPKEKGREKLMRRASSTLRVPLGDANPQQFQKKALGMF